ncbi:MAG: hypothetical protein GF344_12385 [Chitinivibrionales bacterium]|nr:hypothetical protein [Chitinivibrionales bacterium]MBD3357561.1 hypothetical protein [Chitinivibrionales bacterium]
MSGISLTSDHETIQEWARIRRGKPSRVADEQQGTETLSIQFPDSTNGNHERIQWRSFFAKFDKQHLCMAYDNKTEDNRLSQYYQFMPAPRGILLTLHTEHEAVMRLFDELANTTTRATKARTQGALQLEKLLKPHMKGEEKVFYPRLVHECDEEDAIIEILEGYEEHKAAKRVLKDLQKTKPDSLEWAARLSVLQELIVHHIGEEVSEIFPTAWEKLDNDTFEKLDTAYKARERKRIANM